MTDRVSVFKHFVEQEECCLKARGLASLGTPGNGFQRMVHQSVLVLFLHGHQLRNDVRHFVLDARHLLVLERVEQLLKHSTLATLWNLRPDTYTPDQPSK